jgi:hypothetical protein
MCAEKNATRPERVTIGRSAELLDHAPRQLHHKTALARAIKQSEKAGKHVRSASIYSDHVELKYGEPKSSNTDALDGWLNARATKGH